MRVGIREGTESVVVFLTGGIPESEFDMTAVNLDISDVVLEDGGDVDFGEGTLSKMKEDCEQFRGQKGT